MPSNPQKHPEDYRNKLLGLGESSLRKNYYPELRKHMRELEESRTRYKTIFNATADGLFIHDGKSFKIIDFNERVCQMYGYTAEELRHLNFDDLCSGEPSYNAEQATNFIRDALTAEVKTIEWRSRRKDGSVFWTDVSLKSAIIDGQQCVIASVRDISSRKQLEEQLLHSQKMEAMGQLAGGIAHDFNNMLASISGAAEIIHSLAARDDNVFELSEVILKAAETAGNLTKQLLSFSHKGTLEQQPAHIHKAISNAKDILQRSFDRNITLFLDLQAESDLILGDTSLIENIVINLSINARDAMPDGGKLTIHTDNRLPDNSVSLEPITIPAEGFICIEISDTGHGMTEEISQHIFEPFFTTKESGKGTGLGLAAVYGAVQKHNGYIQVKSVYGSGTTFTIFLPLISEDEIPAAASTNKKILGTGKILLIDDDELLRFVGKSMLNTLGYDVFTAEDGILGIQAFKEHQPDIVLLDLIMPNMSSKECFLKLKELNPDIPVIAVSGSTSEGILEDLYKEGLAGFMVKPYKMNTLSKEIASIMSSTKSAPKQT